MLLRGGQEKGEHVCGESLEDRRWPVTPFSGSGELKSGFWSLQNSAGPISLDQVGKAVTRIAAAIWKTQPAATELRISQNI